MSEHKGNGKKELIGTVQTVVISNTIGIKTEADMLITAVDRVGKLQWKRPFPYMDCDKCGYGPYGCHCPDGFVQMK